MTLQMDNEWSKILCKRCGKKYGSNINLIGFTFADRRMCYRCFYYEKNDMIVAKRQKR